MTIDASTLTTSFGAAATDFDLRYQGQAAWSPTLELYAAVMGLGLFYTSPDMQTWTLRHTDGTAAFSNVEWGDSKFVALRSDGYPIISADGVTWTLQALSPVTSTPRKLFWNGSLFVVGCSFSSRHGWSADGITWSMDTTWTAGTSTKCSQIAWSPTLSLFCAALVGKRFVLTSPDGEVWTERPLSVGSVDIVDAMGVAWIIDKFVITSSGSPRRTYTSPDGITWTRVNSGADLFTTASLPLVEIDGAFISALPTFVLATNDGATWTKYVTSSNGGDLVGSDGAVFGSYARDLGSGATLFTAIEFVAGAPVSGDGDILLEAFTAEGEGFSTMVAHIDNEGPMGQCTIIASNDPIAGADITGPLMSALIYGAAESVTVGPMGTFEGAGTGVAVAHIDVIGPTGRAYISGLGGASAQLDVDGPRGAVTVYGAAKIVATLGSLADVVLIASKGDLARVNVIGPGPSAEIEGSDVENEADIDIAGPMLQSIGGAVLVLSAPMATIFIAGSDGVVAEYEAYAVNLYAGEAGATQKNEYDGKGNEVTHYTNYPFTQIVRLKDKYYGVGAGGMYLLDGDTDAGTPIAWAIRTSLMDNKQKNLKTVRSVYIGARLVEATEITLVVGEKQDILYSYSTPRGDNAQTYRQKFGRGVKTRYFALEMSSPEGNNIEIDTVEFETEILERSI